MLKTIACSAVLMASLTIQSIHAFPQNQQAELDWAKTPAPIQANLTVDGSLDSKSQTLQPAIEHSSLLDAFSVKFRDGKMVLNQKHEIMGVFFPKDARLSVDLHTAGSEQSLYHSGCRLAQSGASVFTRIEVIDSSGYTFKTQGDYELRFSLNGDVIAVFPFNIFSKKNGDDFDPKTFTFADGDWSKLSYLSFSADDPTTPLKFNTWTRKVVFSTTPKATKMDITLLQGDEVVAITAQGTVAWPEWQPREKTFAFPENQGGKVFNGSDLLKRTGMHTVRVDLDGTPHQYFNFEVRDGKIGVHSRQKMSYADRTRWLCPRKIRLGLEETSHVFWMERSDAAASDSANNVAAPSTATKSKWVVQPKIDSNRPFQLKQTSIRMRKDMPLSVGDGIVAYATGSQGVGYFVVG